jgi:hypothetical protein
MARPHPTRLFERSRRRTARLALGFVLLLVPRIAFAQGEQIEYYGLDARGSVRVIFDAQGNTVDRMDYGPFGENLRAAIKFSVEDGWVKMQYVYVPQRGAPALRFTMSTIPSQVRSTTSKLWENRTPEAKRRLCVYGWKEVTASGLHGWIAECRAARRSYR